MKLSSVADILSGYPFREKISEKSGGGARVVQMKDVSVSGEISWGGLIETELPGKKSPNWLVKGDVLFAARGSSNYAVFVNENHKNIVSAPHFYILRPREQELMPEFLAWLLNQRPLQNHFKRRSEGSRVMSVRRAVLERTEIAIPPIERQKQILKLNETLQKEKDLYSRMIENTDELMSSIASEVMATKN